MSTAKVTFVKLYSESINPTKPFESTNTTISIYKNCCFGAALI